MRALFFGLAARRLPIGQGMEEVILTDWGGLGGGGGALINAAHAVAREKIVNPASTPVRKAYVQHWGIRNREWSGLTSFFGLKSRVEPMSLHQGFL